MALSTIDEVRLTYGDTEDSPILTDDQVQHYLDANGDQIVPTARDCARAAWRALSMRAVDVTTGSMSAAYARRAELYRQVVIDLGGSVSQAATAAPYIGGIAVAEREAAKDDDSTIYPAFVTGLHDTEERDAKLSEDS
ncbi:MAG: hypothetical protein V2A73_16020 [Pseudomonadota bacterium]